MKMRLPKKVFLWAGILPALFLPLLASLIYIYWSQDVQTAYTVTKIAIFVWPVIWVFFLGGALHTPETKMPLSQAIYRGIIGGLGISLIIFFSFIVLHDFIVLYGESVKRTSEAWGFETPIFYISFSIVLSTLHSFAEEYYWRWFVFGGLSTIMTWKRAALFSSIGFSLHHFVVLQQLFPLWFTLVAGIGVLIGGYLWCMLYKRTGRLVSVWMSHLLVDASIFAIGYMIIFA